MWVIGSYIAEIIGWLVLAYIAWWLVVLLLEVVAILIHRKWPHYYFRVGRFAIYFGAAVGIGTCQSFRTVGDYTYDRLFWLFFWRRPKPKK